MRAAITALGWGLVAGLITAALHYATFTNLARAIANGP